MNFRYFLALISKNTFWCQKILKIHKIPNTKFRSVLIVQSENEECFYKYNLSTRKDMKDNNFVFLKIYIYSDANSHFCVMKNNF